MAHLPRTVGRKAGSGRSADSWLKRHERQDAPDARGALLCSTPLPATVPPPRASTQPDKPRGEQAEGGGVGDWLVVEA